MEQTNQESIDNISEVFNGAEPEYPPGSGVDSVVTLYQLYAGIAFSGIIAELVIALFFSDRFLYHSAGLAAGLLVAAFMAFHMHRSILSALDFSEGDAVTHVRNGALVRYFAACAVMLAVYFTDAGNGLLYVVGVFTLKSAAYMQPLIDRHTKWFK